MTRTRTTALTGTLFLLAAAVALTLVFLTGRSSGGNQVQLRLGAAKVGPLSKESAEGKAGEGPASGTKVAMFAVAIAVVLGALFYGLNNTSINQAGSSISVKRKIRKTIVTTRARG